LSLVASGGLALGVAFLTWPRRNRPDSFALEVGLTLVAFSLIVPLTWYHHLTIDLIPLLLAWFATSRRSLRVALVIAYGFIGVQGLAWKVFTGQTLLLSLGTYGLLLIYAVTAIILWQADRQPEFKRLL
jgi:heme A synthase